jgi:hypothetical protein
VERVLAERREPDPLLSLKDLWVRAEKAPNFVDDTPELLDRGRVCELENRSRAEKFSIRPEATSPFGTVTRVRPSVRTRVDRKPTSSTVPESWPIVT